MSTGLRRKLTIDFTIPNEPLEVYGAESRAFFIKGRGESMRHVMMKLMSYIMFYQEDLLIEASADQSHKPDLVRFNMRNEPLQWIDCGQTSLQKLDRISSSSRNRMTYIEIVKATLGELESYYKQADTRLANPERVRYWSFRDYFIEELGEILHGRHKITATVSAGHTHVYLLIDDRVDLRTPIHLLGSAPLPGVKLSPQDEPEY